MVTLIGMIPYAGLSFTSFDRIKRLVLKNQVHLLTMESKSSTVSDSSSAYSNNTNALSNVNYNKPAMVKKYYDLTVVGKLICGAITGVVTQTVTYPVDVVRRHMQLMTMLTDSSIKE